MSPNTSKLAITELIIYTFVLPLCVWLCVKYSFQRSISWLCLVLLSILHIFESSYQIGTQINAKDTIDILDTVGLTLILIAFSGILHQL